jgi:hypothetical protein
MHSIPLCGSSVSIAADPFSLLLLLLLLPPPPLLLPLPLPLDGLLDTVDHQPENRERAMVALSQLTPAMDTDTITALAARFIKLARSTLKPKAKKVKTMKNSEQVAAATDALATPAQAGSDEQGERTSIDSAIVKRIGGVLGLGGLLCGYPYSVEDWGPAVVQELAERAFDPSPIDVTAKKILSEFKRTHADLWEEEHKGKFDSSQLSSLQDALVTPHSMFA